MSVWSLGDAPTQQQHMHPSAMRNMHPGQQQQHQQHAHFSGMAGHPGVDAVMHSQMTLPQDDSLELIEDYDEEDDGYDEHPGAQGRGKVSHHDYAMDVGAMGSENEKKQIRKRSSKACDQCRKSKCKCERTGVPGEPCKNCQTLATACTFLGPSKKRGPPKGYIDAIESRLHQAEALLGIILRLSTAESNNSDPAFDPRAATLVRDLLGPDVDTDGLVKGIVSRIERGVYGRRSSASVSDGEGAPSARDGTPFGRGRMLALGQDDSRIVSFHPSTEWQDGIIQRFRNRMGRTSMQQPSITTSVSQGNYSPLTPQHNSNFTFDSGYGLNLPNNSNVAGGSDERARQRRRVDIDPSVPQVQGPMSATSRSLTRVKREGMGDIGLLSLNNGGLGSRSRSLGGRGPRNASGQMQAPGLPIHTIQRSPSTLSQHSFSGTGGRSDGYASPARSRSRDARPLISHPDPPNQNLDRSSAELEHTDSARGSVDGDREFEAEGELADAMGQLSVNEDSQVRFHGKVSGLHLLVMGDQSSKLNVKHGRNEGGLWRFPKARVWPQAPYDATMNETDAEDNYVTLPDPVVQEHLLELYFIYVHPYLPIIHKTQFWKEYFEGQTRCILSSSPRMQTGVTGEADTRRNNSLVASYRTTARQSDSLQPMCTSPNCSHTNARIPSLLLLIMFAISARYSSSRLSSINNQPIPPSGSGQMWPAGDEYLNGAKILLDRTYASSRPSTCQALLLMAYREIGIGAMAQSWTYTGMAVRMAQDLGLHRSSDGWVRVAEGGALFSNTEQQERKRIWYGCVIMDKYVSTYIGRPLSIFERDYDTKLPAVDEIEETELWQPHPSMPPLRDAEEFPQKDIPFTPVPARIISCFNASASLASIIASMVQGIYAVKPSASLQEESVHIEERLGKWYYELPSHLQYEPSSKGAVPPPHVLTLHLQYWCAVILLHRPFIRPIVWKASGKQTNALDTQSEPDVVAVSTKSYSLCVSAANHITSIVSTFLETYGLRRAAVFLSYYVFTAGIHHVVTLRVSPNDPQAHLGLVKCMEALHNMAVVWPSADRAWELLNGCKEDMAVLPADTNNDHIYRRNKRPAGDLGDMSTAGQRGYNRLEIPSVREPDQYGSASPYSNQSFGQAQTALPPSRNDYGPPSANTDATPMNIYESYDRWSGNDIENPLLAFPSGLSTSVIPQQYSTGFMDSSDRTSLSRMGNQSHQSTGSDIQRTQNNSIEQPTYVNTGGQNRFGPYWNAYPALGQNAPSSMSVLNSMYGMPVPGAISPGLTDQQVGQQQQQQQQYQQQQQPSMYMSSPFNLFPN